MARSLKSVAARGDKVGGMIEGDKLAVYRDRIASLMKEQKEIGDEIKDVAYDCADAGVATSKEIKQLARESLKEPDVLSDHLARMDALRQALASLADTPLGKAAIAEEEAAPLPRRRRKNNVTPFGAARQHFGLDRDPPEVA